MKNKKFEIFTTKQFKFIPEDVVVIKNVFGWVFLYFAEGQVYTNSTNSGVGCKKEENEVWLKRIVKQLKKQMKETRNI